jgi:hypothetical protein
MNKVNHFESVSECESVEPGSAPLKKRVVTAARPSRPPSAPDIRRGAGRQMAAQRAGYGAASHSA